METVSSQYLSPWSPASTPPQTPEAYIGSFVTMISNNNLRYEGIVCFLNIQDSILGLQNVICYGTEGRNTNGFQVPPYNKVYEYILFNGNNFKEIIVKPPSCGYCLARGSTCSKACLATKPPLPIIVSPNNRSGAKILQQLPLISNDNLIIPQATTESNAFSVNGSVNDRLHIASQQQYYPGSYLYDPYVYQSMPYVGHNQASINAASLSNLPESSTSEMTSAASKSLFTTFLPAPVSMPRNSGGCDFEAMTKNSIPYNIWSLSIYKEVEKIWGPSKNKEEEIIWGFFKNKEEQDIWGPLKNKEEESAKPAYNIDGSSYMISRNPFEPIGRPCNPLGPIARPVKHTEVCFTTLTSSYS
ncbi:Lsm14-like N-terminal [Arabidopsis thaliana x Arabidopsis arenosa]|uniref:Lsm14-like N-terminal n=1 Tax=Arabidopsis thaliana x Arabidopsis arenosa TaxID=1240361 RepID=A0A8T1Y512_9BRAS|nr:Lsm14-like N-terminal [Arabidopsis thaliana x Arabidopsis arenosa]